MTYTAPHALSALLRQPRGIHILLALSFLPCPLHLGQLQKLHGHLRPHGSHTTISTAPADHLVFMQVAAIGFQSLGENAC